MRKYDSAVIWIQCTKFFDHLSLSGVIDVQIFCENGKFSPESIVCNVYDHRNNSSHYLVSWTPDRHCFYPKLMRDAVLVLMMIRECDTTLLYFVPRELMYLIIKTI